jgi:hypothetical protein
MRLFYELKAQAATTAMQLVLFYAGEEFSSGVTHGR